MTWEYHMDDSAESRHAMILGRYLLTALGLNFKFYGTVITGGYRPFEGCK